MPKYFFHLMGDVPAHDLLGHDCTNDKVAEEYGKMLASVFGESYSFSSSHVVHDRHCEFRQFMPAFSSHCSVNGCEVAFW